MQHDQAQPQAFPLRESLSLLRRRRWSIVMITLLVAGLAIGYVALRPATYRSTTLVEVRPLTIDEELQPFAADSFVNMDTEAARVTQEPVMKAAAEALGMDPDSSADLEALVDQLEVTTKTNTTFVEIDCTETSPSRAQGCAAAVADAYIDDRVQTAEELYQRRVDAESAKIQQANEQIHVLSEQLDGLGEDAARTALQAQIDAQSQLIVAAQTSILSMPTASPDAALLAQSADLPTSPSNKDFLSIGLLAALLGLAVGTAVSLFRERLAEPVSGPDHLEGALLAPVIGVVPQHAAWRSKRMRRPVTLAAPESPASQAYKTARAALLQSDAQVIAVVSPGQGDGKSATVANLAVVLAQSGHWVVAVSCDFRQPRLHRLFDRSNEVGLTNVLTRDRVLHDAIVDTNVRRLALIPSGPIVEDPSRILGGDAMRRALDELRLRYDFVLLDTAPALLVADAISLAPLTDGVIVVADGTRTRQSDVTHLRRQFERAGAEILGGILNIHARQADLSYESYGWSEADRETLGGFADEADIDRVVEAEPAERDETGVGVPARPDGTNGRPGSGREVVDPDGRSDARDRPPSTTRSEGP